MATGAAEVGAVRRVIRAGDIEIDTANVKLGINGWPSAALKTIRGGSWVAPFITSIQLGARF
jgi:hypothetical protein